MLPWDSVQYANHGQQFAFDSASLAIFNAFTTPPTSARRVLIDTCVKAMKTAGVWTLMDALWMFAAADSQAATINWVNPGGTAATPTTSPTFTADRGFNGDGSTSYVNTNFIPSAGTNFTQNNAHFSNWDLTNRAADTTQSGVAQTGNGTISITPFFTGSLFVSRLNDSAGNTVASAGSNGHSLVSKTTGTTRNNFRNGASLGSSTSAVSATRASIAIFIGGTNTNGTLTAGTTDQYAMASVGAGLTGTQITNFYNALQTYLHALGAV